VIKTTQLLSVASPLSSFGLVFNSDESYSYGDLILFPEVSAHWVSRLKPEQRIPDELSALGELAKTSEGSIIKLLNISASIPQLLECIAELQAKGYDISDYRAYPKNAQEEAIKAVYTKVFGSAVNPTSVTTFTSCGGSFSFSEYWGHRPCVFFTVR